MPFFKSSREFRNRQGFWFGHFLLGLMVFSLIRCSTPSSFPPLSLKGFSHKLKPGDIVETRTGAILSFESLIDKLSNVQLVYVGETHTRKEDHRIQLEILKGLYTRYPSLKLGLEMFPTEAQPALDHYSQGLISEKEFLKESDWGKNWGYPFDLYRGIFHWARARGLKMVGLNAPIEVVNRIAHNGLEALNPEERARVAAKFFPDHQEHRDYLQKQYSHHPPGKIKNFQTFYEAQLAWEETMAETLAQWLSSLPPENPIVVLIGRGHILYHIGLPRLVRARKEHAFATILSIPVDYPFSTLDPRLADYLWIIDKSDF